MSDTTPVARRLRFLPRRREIIAGAALGTLPHARSSDVCGICRDEEQAQLYDPCGRDHGLCADCIIDWVSSVDDDGLSRDFCPYCRAVFCQKERLRRFVTMDRADNDDDNDEDMDLDFDQESIGEDEQDSDAGSDVASVASDVDAQMERLDQFLQGADDDLRRFWWWLRQVLAVILGMRVLAWYGLWAPPNR